MPCVFPVLVLTHVLLKDQKATNAVVFFSSRFYKRNCRIFLTDCFKLNPIWRMCKWITSAKSFLATLHLDKKNAKKKPYKSCLSPIIKA